LDIVLLDVLKSGFAISNCFMMKFLFLLIQHLKFDAEFNLIAEKLYNAILMDPY